MEGDNCIREETGGGLLVWRMAVGYLIVGRLGGNLCLVVYE